MDQVQNGQEIAMGDLENLELEEVPVAQQGFPSKFSAAIQRAREAARQAQEDGEELGDSESGSESDSEEQPKKSKMTPKKKAALKSIKQNAIPVRHRHVKKKNITNPSIKRLARRAGCKRISSNMYREVKGAIRIFMDQIIRDSVLMSGHARRKTVTVKDVVYALRKNNNILYGYDN